MWRIDEDAYWERRREEWETQQYNSNPERKLLSLDDELDDLQQEYRCMLEELGEPDLEEIVYRLRGVYPMTATYDPDYIAIFYEVEAA